MDPELRPVQTSTSLREGGPPCLAVATPDGWNVNIHYDDGEQHRTYVFDTAQAEQFIESIQRALVSAKLARRD